MDIAARALLVNTTVRVWTGEKRDRAITREICTMKGAEANAVRANKSLLGEHIHGVQTAERAVRQTVHERTLPWMEHPHPEGLRLRGVHRSNGRADPSVR